jgi:hypothetical protein
MKNTPKPIYVSSPVIKCWSGTAKLIQLIRKEGIYLYNVLLLSTLYAENKRLLRPLTPAELFKAFPCYHDTFIKTLRLCLDQGFIENQRDIATGNRGKATKFKLVYTLKGEMLLKKYEKLLGEITEGY